MKVDKPDRSQRLKRMAARISLISGALDFTILGIELTWILVAATMLCVFLSPLECRAGVSPLVLQNFADWERQHRGNNSLVAAVKKRPGMCKYQPHQNVRG